MWRHPRPRRLVSRRESTRVPHPSAFCAGGACPKLPLAGGNRMGGDFDFLSTRTIGKAAASSRAGRIVCYQGTTSEARPERQSEAIKSNGCQNSTIILSFRQEQDDSRMRTVLRSGGTCCFHPSPQLRRAERYGQSKFASCGKRPRFVSGKVSSRADSYLREVKRERSERTTRTVRDLGCFNPRQRLRFGFTRGRQAEPSR
jgi:hypothetical protein